MTTCIYKREMTINTATLSARLHLPSRRTIRKTKSKVPHSSLIYRRGQRRLPQGPSSVADVCSTTSNITHTTESPINQTKRPYSDNPFSWSFRQRRRRRRQGRIRIQRRPRKIVVVGTMNCGKSSLISAYCRDQFSDIYQPTILRCLPSDARVQGQKIDIIVVDTPGRMDYLPIRRCAYQKADLIMICFALDQPVSLDHVKDYWIQEIKNHTSSIPYILVGTCMDKRDELYANWCNCSLCQECVLGCDKRWKKSKTTNEYLQQTIVAYEQGQSLAKDIGALAYIECSAKYRDGTRQVFDQATDIAVRKHRRKRKHKMRAPEGCTIL